MAIKNMQASVLVRLKNQAKEEKIPFQMVLQLFAQEEFLRKLSLSDKADNLVLKGGMFIYTLTRFESRPTRDIDFLIQDIQGDLDSVEQTMREICATETGHSFMTIEVLGSETIAANKKYPGVRTRFMGHIANVRIPFSIDVGIDDIIVPGPVKREIATRLPDFDAPKVLTYSLESTIAEKFDAILQRMAGTSRMKDFYDIYYLSEVFDFDGSILKEAISVTLEHRKTDCPLDVFQEISSFRDNEFLNIQWNAFDAAKKAGLSFEKTLDRIAVLLDPVYQSIQKKEAFNRYWKSTSAKWESS